MTGEINRTSIDLPISGRKVFNDSKPESEMTVEEAKDFWGNLFASNDNLSQIKPFENDKIDSDDAHSYNKNKVGITVEKAKGFWVEKFSKEIVADDDINSNDENQFENPRQEVIEGVSYYYDDNGNLYRVGNDLQPNCKYEINGYKYQTDAQGRIVSAEGNLKIKNREGRLPIKDSIADIGKGDERETDDRGHLIGDQFDGSNGLENMIPQDADINRNDYKNFENQLAKEVKEGKGVVVKVEPIYDGNSKRPDAVVVTYSIDGEENVRIFPNGEEKE